MLVNNVLILGYGNIVNLLAEMLSKLHYKILIIDNKTTNQNKFPAIELNIKNSTKLSQIIKKHKIDTIISCLPYNLNKNIAKLCVIEELQYFDFTEDIKTCKYIRKISRNTNQIFMPQNGLAPGLIGMLGNSLI